MINKNAILITVLAGFVVSVSLGVGYYFIFLQTDGPDYNIHKFNGTVIEIGDNEATLRGVFDTQEKVPLEVISVREFSFKVDKKTQFKKVEIGRPPIDRTKFDKDGNGSYTIKIDFKDLPRVETIGSFDDLKNIFLEGSETIYVKADFSKSIYSSRNPVADYVRYEIFTQPEPFVP